MEEKIPFSLIGTCSNLTNSFIVLIQSRIFHISKYRIKDLKLFMYFIKLKLNCVYKRKEIIINILSNYLMNITSINFNIKNTKPEYVKFLNYFPNIINLDINDVDLNLEWIDELSKLKKQNTLVRLILKSIKMSSQLFHNLLSLPYFSSITELDLHENNLNCEQTKTISNLNFSNLKILNLSHNKIQDDGVFFLKHSTIFNQLEILNLKKNSITKRGAEYLSEVNISNLIQLDISNNPIEDEGVKFLSKANLSNLSLLNLSFCKISEDALKFLSNGNLINITELILSKNKIHSDGVKHLSFSNMKKINRLDLSRNLLNEEASKFLAQGNLKEIIELDLSSNMIYDEALEFLFNPESNLKQLETLNLALNLIGADGVYYLANSCIESIEFLIMTANLIRNDGLDYLIEESFLEIEALDLRYNNYEDCEKKEQQIASSTQSNLINRKEKYDLKFLNLSYNRIKEEALDYLVNGNLRMIKYLSLMSNLIQSDGIKKFVEQNLRINKLFLK